MLRMRESVANSQFNAGEILVTEVKLELDGQFGYGMVIDDCPRIAVAVAVVDAAIRKTEPIAHRLEQELAQLHMQIVVQHMRLYDIAATTKVAFEVI